MYVKLIKDHEKDIRENYGKPYYVYLSLSNICNANCRFCDVRENRDKLNRLDIEKLIDELSELGTKYVHFTGGGEPFINKDIFDYIEYANTKGIKVVFITNGLNLNENDIERVAGNIDFCFFSIDSHNPAVHNSLRRTNNLFESAIRNINMIKKYNKDSKIVLNHVLNSENIDDFSDFIGMRQAVNFDYINPIVIKDCAELTPTKEQVQNFTKSIDGYNELALRFGVQFLCDNLNLFDETCARNPSRDIICVYPEYCAFIDCPTGNVYPCDCAMHRDKQLYKIGNLIDSSFTDIWNGATKKQLAQKLFNKELNCIAKCDEANCLFNRCYSKAKGGIE